MTGFVECIPVIKQCIPIYLLHLAKVKGGYFHDLFLILQKLCLLDLCEKWYLNTNYSIYLLLEFLPHFSTKSLYVVKADGQMTIQ